MTFDIFKFSHKHKQNLINSIEKSSNDITTFEFITTTHLESSYQYIFKISNFIFNDDIYFTANENFGCINISKTKTTKQKNTYIHYFYKFKLEDDMQMAIASIKIAANQLIIDIPKTFQK